MEVYICKWPYYRRKEDIELEQKKEKGGGKHCHGSTMGREERHDGKEFVKQKLIQVINKIDKPLARLTRKIWWRKLMESEIKEGISADLSESKITAKKCYK